MNRSFKAAMLTILALGTLTSMLVGGTAWAQYRSDWYGSSATVPAGTSIDVRLDSKISTDDERAGDTWTGTVANDVYAGDRLVIPSGTPVTGVIRSSVQGTHDTKPRLELAIRRLTIDGRSYTMNATSGTIVGGSKRAKKIGAIVGGAAVGALLGNAVGGKKGAVIGGLAGGGAGYGLTRHALRTMQLKEGTVVSFTTRTSLIARR